jgi:predicted nucleotidyltransferase component of viral defense system
MVTPQLVRRYAFNQQIGLDVADQEIVLHYALKLLNLAGLVGIRPDGSPGPLLFKGGTALRKCLFGTSGRFSQDIDLDAPSSDGFEAQAEAAFVDNNPFHDISFRFDKTRWSEDENFSGTVAYEHNHGSGIFELQISYRLHPVLEPRELTLVAQEYLTRVEFEPPWLYGLDPYEMIGEKLMACNRRQGGSAKDVYDLYLWSEQAFDEALVRRIGMLKAWSDRRRRPLFEPEAFLEIIEPRHFRWEDLNGLVPRKQHQDRKRICEQVRRRFCFLTSPTEDEQTLLEDQVAHRHHTLYEGLRNEARAMADSVVRWRVN